MAILGVGTHLIEAPRIGSLIQRHGELFIERVYTPHEVDYCASRKFATQHYAAHWAAKEAILMAMGTGRVRGIGWRDVEVRHPPACPPTVHLYGGAREVLERSGIVRIHVALSHCRAYATAHAVAEG